MFARFFRFVGPDVYHGAGAPPPAGHANVAATLGTPARLPQGCRSLSLRRRYSETGRRASLQQHGESNRDQRA